MEESWGVLVWARALSVRQKSAVRHCSTLMAPQDSPTYPNHPPPPLPPLGASSRPSCGRVWSDGKRLEREEIQFNQR